MHPPDLPIDLHAHTDHSDGTLTPEELVAAARAAGLSALAVTDHDTTTALPAARRAAARGGPEILDGCEISAQIDGDTVHVLAYAFEPGDAAFEGFLARVRCGREERNGRLYRRLEELGVPVSPADVAAHVQGSIVARPHFARAMVDRGHVPDVRAAFQRYLGDHACAYVKPQTPRPEEAIAATRAAGGVAVLAHPGQLRCATPAAYRALLQRLAAAGLAGVEADHPSHDEAERRMFRDLARDLGLVATAGSDFHGASKPWIALGTGDGTVRVTRATWEGLLERRP